MSEPKPVSTSNSQTSSSASATPTPTVTTVVIPGTVITATTYVTVPTTVTVTTTVITATRTATATITMPATAPATTATTTTTTATTSAEKPEDISNERAERINEIDELINSLGQLIASRGGSQASQDVIADINRLQQIKDRAQKAKTLNELKSLEQEFESIKSKYASLLGEASGVAVNIDYTFYTIPDNVALVPQQQAPASTPAHTTITALPGMLKVGNTVIPLQEKTVTYTYEVRQSGDGYEVRGKNIDYFAKISKDSITIGNSKESQTLRKDDVAKLFVEFMVSSGIYTKEHWQQLYNLIGGDKFRDILRKWLNGEKLSPEEVAFLADKVKNLANLRFLYDYSTLKKADPRFARDISDTAWFSLSPWERLQYNLTHFRYETEDEVFNNVLNILVEKFKRGELNSPPGEGKWKFEEIAQKIAQYSPLNWVYTQIYNALYPYLGSGASVIASTAVGALIALLPLMGAVVAGATGASIGATVATGLSIEALGSGLVGLAGLASKLTDPEARKAFIDWLNQNWALLAMEIAGSIAGGYLGAKAIERLPADILAKPKIWNTLPEKVRQNLIDAGIIYNVPGLKGTVAEARIVLKTGEAWQIGAELDQDTKTLTLTLTAEGQGVIDKVDLPKDLTEKWNQLLASEGIYSENERYALMGNRVIMMAKGFFAGDESKESILQKLETFKSFLKNLSHFVSENNEVALQLLKDLSEESIVGEFAFTATPTDFIFLDKAKKVAYVGTADKQLVRAVFADDRLSTLFENMIKKLNIKDVYSIIGYSNQAYVYTDENIGTWARTLFLRMSPTDPKEAERILNDLIKVADLLKLDTAFRQQVITGGVPITQLVPKYVSDPSLFERPDVQEFLRQLARFAQAGIDYSLVFIPSANTLDISVVSFAQSPQALSQSIAKAVEQGVKPEAMGFRAMPIHTQVIEPVVVTQSTETFTSTVTKAFTDITRTMRLREMPINRAEAIPVVVTQTAESTATSVATSPTSMVKTMSLTEKPVHRTDTVPYIATKYAEAVQTAVETKPTGTVETKSLTESPIHRTETVPEVVTQTAENTATNVVTVPTNFTKTMTLIENPVRNTDTVPVVVPSTITLTHTTTT
ncbi:MAG: sulfite exporter TauE/SafE family protein, partial [Ignisphaera sp.]|nr:sulfite exporter TauE/SafE family protein [Ignisphaera sp.]